MKYSQTIRHTGLYILAAVVPAAISLLINPFVAKNMSPLDYATVGYYNSFTTLFIPLVSLYLTHYYSKRYYECDEEGRKRLKALIYKVFFYISPIITFTVGAGLWCYSHYFNPESSIQYFPYALIYLSTLYFQCFFTLELVDMKMRRLPLSYFKLSMIQSAIIISSTVLLVIILKWGAVGKLLAVLIEAFILFFAIFLRNIDLMQIKITFKEIRDSLVFCFPLIIAAMLSFFTKGYDSVLLERLGNNVEFANYTIGLQFSGYLGMITTALQNTFQSDIYESIHQSNRKKTLKIFGLLSVSTIFIVGIFCLLAPFVVRILTYNRYADAAPYAILTSISLVFSVSYYFLSTIFIARGRTKATLLNKVVVAAFTFVCYPLIINKFEYVGGACAISLAFFAGILGYLLLMKVNYAEDPEHR